MVSCLTHCPMLLLWSCLFRGILRGLPLVAISRIWVDEEISMFWFPDSCGSSVLLSLWAWRRPGLPPSTLASQLRCSPSSSRFHCPFLSLLICSDVMMSSAPLVFSKWLWSKTAFFPCLFVLNKHTRNSGIELIERQSSAQIRPWCWHPEIFWPQNRMLASLNQPLISTEPRSSAPVKLLPAPKVRVLCGPLSSVLSSDKHRTCWRAQIILLWLALTGAQGANYTR